MDYWEYAYEYKTRTDKSPGRRLAKELMYAVLDSGSLELYVSRALTSVGYDLKSDFFWAGELAGRYGRIAFKRRRDCRVRDLPTEEWNEFYKSPHEVN